MARDYCSTETSYATIIRGSYLPHVDGIRAVAVIPVLLYHLCSMLCPGGFAGVDVFFVISGYLIGGGIINDLRKNEFSFSGFYTRRIKRIMPAYFAMILATLLVGCCIYHYEPLKSLGNASLRSSYFFSNFFCYKFLGDYFAGNAELHPLINLWSLSVEEQFYIVTPLLMWILWKCRKNMVLPILIALMVASFIYAEAQLHSGEQREILKSFYMLVSRAWELLAGVGMAFLPRLELASETKSKAADWLALFGMALVVGAYACLNSQSHFPGAGAICSVAGCALLIRYGAYGVIGKFLSNSLTVGIGRISYSLYLWHWPVIAYMRYIYDEELSVGQILFATVLSFILAIVSWKFIEMPIRRAKNIGVWKASLGLIITCGIAGGLGAVLYKTNGLVDVIHQDANFYRSTEYPRSLDTVKAGTCNLQQLSLINDKGRRVDNVIKYLGCRDKSPEFVLIGDSHAEAIQIGLDDISKERKRCGVAVGMKTCPLYGIEITNTFANAIDPFLEWLQQATSVKTVILVCRWNTRLSTSQTNQYLYKKGESIPTDASRNTELLKEGLIQTCEKIKALGKDVVILGPVPELKFNPGSEIRRHIMLGYDTSDIGDSVTHEEFIQHEAPVLAILELLAQKKLARIIPIHEPLLQDGKYRGIQNNMLYYHDDNHLSGDGSRHVIKHIYSQIFRD